MFNELKLVANELLRINISESHWLIVLVKQATFDSNVRLERPEFKFGVIGQD